MFCYAVSVERTDTPTSYTVVVLADDAPAAIDAAHQAIRESGVMRVGPVVSAAYIVRSVDILAPMGVTEDPE